MPPSRPLVGVPSCRKEIAPHHYHCVGEKYLEAMTDGAGALPVMVPALGERVASRELLQHLDGLLLTGSYSNVQPHRYAGPESVPGTAHDPARDDTVFALIKEAVRMGVPLLGICRGCQEINVAYGGSLHQRVHEQPGMMDHREDTAQPIEVQYGPAHEVALALGGVLSEIAGADRLQVNSIHWQGVDRLGEGLAVEATASDGLVEGFSVRDASAMAVAVQWHPEWRFADNPFSLKLFEYFGEQMRRYARARQ